MRCWSASPGWPARRADDVRRGVLTKGPKPGQELRVDMPAIGPRTIELAVAARLAGVAVEAGGVLMLDRDETIRGADAHGCAIEGLARADVGQVAQRGVRLWCGARHGARTPERARQNRHRQGLGGCRAARPFRDRVGGCRGPRLHPGVCRRRVCVLRCLRGCARSGSGACAGSAGSASWCAARTRPRMPQRLRRCATRLPRQGLAGIAVTGTPEALAPYEDIAAARGRPWPVPGNMPAEQYEVARWRTFRQQDLGARACGNDAFPRTATTSACS